MTSDSTDSSARRHEADPSFSLEKQWVVREKGDYRVRPCAESRVFPRVHRTVAIFENRFLSTAALFSAAT
jgi:hypothetical protein